MVGEGGVLAAFGTLIDTPTFYSNLQLAISYIHVFTVQSATVTTCRIGFTFRTREGRFHT